MRAPVERKFGIGNILGKRWQHYTALIVGKAKFQIVAQKINLFIRFAFETTIGMDS